MAENKTTIEKLAETGAPAINSPGLNWFVRTFLNRSDEKQRDDWLKMVGSVKLAGDMTIYQWMQVPVDQRKEQYNKLAVWASVAGDALGPDDLRVLGFGFGMDPDTGGQVDSVTSFNDMYQNYLATGGTDEGGGIMISASDGVVEDVGTENLLGGVATAAATGALGAAANLYRYGFLESATGAHVATSEAAGAFSTGADMIARPTARTAIATAKLAGRIIKPIAALPGVKPVALGASAGGITMLGRSIIDQWLNPQANVEADYMAQEVGPAGSDQTLPENYTEAQQAGLGNTITNDTRTLLSDMPPQEPLPMHYIRVADSYIAHVVIPGTGVAYDVTPRYVSDASGTGRQDEIDIFNDMSSQRIAAFQDKMVRAGLLTENGYFSGVADVDTQKAMVAVMGQANVDGTPWEAAADHLAALGDKNTRLAELAAQKARVFVLPTKHIPDAAGLVQDVKAAFQQRLGRQPHDWEIPLLADKLKADYDAKYAAEVSAARQQFDAQTPAGEIADQGNGDFPDTSTVSGGTVTDVSPLDRLFQNIDLTYAGEIANKEAATAMNESGQRLRSILAGVQSMVTGQ